MNRVQPVNATFLDDKKRTCYRIDSERFLAERKTTMSQVLIRGIDEDVLDRLRKRAIGNNRSLEGELREILYSASLQVDVETARNLMEEMRARLGGRVHSDSAVLIREDRDR
jgi:plasmid stability protein